TMLPGLSLYRALGGALQLARSPELVDSTALIGTLSNAFQGCLVVSSLALGLILGTRAVLTLTGALDSPPGAHLGQDSDQAAHHAATESASREPTSTPSAGA